MFKNIFLAAILVLAGLPSVFGQAFETSGITEPFLDVTLGLADAGIINSQFFKEGDSVHKGDVILELDKNLENIEVTRRKAVMDQDKMIYDSTRELSENTKSVSKEDLMKAESAYNVSSAEYKIAVQQLADRQLVAPFLESSLRCC